jgi:RNA polymerase sigma-70 factor (ECF subfamily)
VTPDLREELARLAALVARGDREAFLTLYDRTSPKVYGLALKMTRDPLAAQEVVQEAYLKLWTRAETFHPDRGSLLNWLLTITRNAALDQLRRATRRPNLAEPPDPEDGWEPQLGDAASQTDEARWGSLYFAVQDLPREQRQVITCAYYHGMSHSQIADYLGVPLGTVKTRLRLGMEKLRQAWLEASESSQRGQSDARRSDVDKKGKA